MPLLLAPLVPIALRLGAVAAAGFAIRRLVAARIHPGRRDQRCEDAMDDLGEGLTRHYPAQATGASQSNTGLRLRRTLRWGKTGIEFDAALLGRFRIRKL